MLTDLGLKPRRLTAQAEAMAACGGLKPFFVKKSLHMVKISYWFYP